MLDKEIGKLDRKSAEHMLNAFRSEKDELKKLEYSLYYAVELKHYTEDIVNELCKDFTVNNKPYLEVSYEIANKFSGADVDSRFAYTTVLLKDIIRFNLVTLEDLIKTRVYPKEIIDSVAVLNEDINIEHISIHKFAIMAKLAELEYNLKLTNYDELTDELFIRLKEGFSLYNTLKNYDIE